MATETTASVPPVVFCPPEHEVNYDLLVTEDDQPVDSIYAERQHWLLTTPLSESWKGPGDGCPFWASTDVGLFYDAKEPAFSPDAFLSLGVSPPQGDLSLKENRSYFIWKYLKPPDALVEVVSNTKGGELTTKFQGYANLGAKYYVVWDPFLFLGDVKLRCFVLEHGKYVPCEPWFPELELGLKVWEGVYLRTQATYLRWCDLQGNLIPTGPERAEQANQRLEQANQRLKQADQRLKQADQRVEQANQRLKQADQRANQLAEKLRALGVDPDQP